jgi:hypothetical protein
MAVIADDLEPQVEMWDDPGPARCGAGSALPSSKFISCVDGSVTVELTAANLIYAIQEEFWGPLETDTTPKIRVKTWAAKKLELVDGKIHLTLEVEDFEADDVCDEPDPDRGRDDE